MTDDEQVAALHRLHITLQSLITWLPQSPGDVLTRDEAKRLLAILDGRRAPYLVGRYVPRVSDDENQTPRETADPLPVYDPTSDEPTTRGRK